MEQNILFPGVKDGETFEVAGIEFIKFHSADGMTPVVAKDILFTNRFGNNNNFAESQILRRLQEEVLPKIVGAVGEDNVCSFKTDLTTWDGLKTYGEVESKISLPTMDFYRSNPEIFDKYKADRWWWLATADSAAPRWGDDPFVLCVSPHGFINGDGFINVSIGVRPFCIFKSSIFGSSEE